MTILVTGGSGFIGTNLVRYLLKHTSHSVLNVDKLTYAAHRHALDDLAMLDASRGTTRPRGEAPPDRYELVQADIADGPNLREVLERTRPTAVIHLAAESHVDRSIDSPAPFIHTNLVGTFTLLDESYRYWSKLSGKAKENFRFLHISSDEVYGSLGDDGAFTEETPYDPHSPYAASKAGADHLASAWFRTYGLPVVITNCSNNYGPYQYPEKLIPHMILRALRGESLPIYGQGTNVRDWLYVEDHVRGLCVALDRGRPGQKYNIGGHGERRNIELVQELCAILDHCQPRPDGSSYRELIRFVPDRPGHDYRYAIDPSKFEREFDWRPAHRLEDGLRSTVKWYLENRSWWESILSSGYRLERLGTTGCSTAADGQP